MSLSVRYLTLLTTLVFPGSILAQAPAPLPPEAESRTKEDLAYFNKEGQRSGLTNLKIDTKFEFPRVLVTGFRANLGSGTVTGTGRVDLFNPLGQQKMKVAYRRVPLAAYVRSYLVKWDADITGTIDADLDLTWRGISREGAKRSMNGTGTVRYSGGTIRRASAVQQAGKMAGLAKPLPQTIRRGTARGTITNGVLRIDQLRIIGQDTAAEATGQVGLSSGVADTQFTLYSREGLTSQGSRRSTSSASWAGAAGKQRLPVSLTISGDLENPDIRVDKN